MHLLVANDASIFDEIVGTDLDLREEGQNMDVVQLNDVLYAMADSVMETVPKPFNPVLKFQDKKINIKIGGKPPREIFYRKTLTFLTKLPPPVQPKICSCQYLCDGDPAVIKCHSCSIYTPTNAAFYCQKCFDARHPWYRVAHIYSSIEIDESIEHTLKVAHRISEATRYEKEGQELLKGLMHEKSRVEYIADDEKIDNQMREFGRRAVALEDHIEQLRKNLRVDMEVSVRRKSLVMNEHMHERWMKRLSMHMDQTASISEAHRSNLEEALAAAQKILDTEGSSPPKLVPTAPILEEIMPLPRNKSIRGSMVGSIFLPMINTAVSEAATSVDQQHQQQPETTESVLLPQDTRATPEIDPIGSDSVPPPAAISNNDTAPQSNTLDNSPRNEDSTDQTISALPFAKPSVVEDPVVEDPVSEESQSPSSAIPLEVFPTPVIDELPATAEEPIGDNDTINDNNEATIRKYDESIAVPAARKIQAAWRGYLVRRMVSDMMLLRLLRVWSPTYGREYYYDRLTGQSSWVLTKLIMRGDVDDLEYVSEDSQYLIWVCKRNLSRSSPRPVNAKRAIQILQGFGRCILARKRIISVANQKYRRVWDADSGTFYYADVIVGDTSWQKSGVYLSLEPPVYRENENKKKRTKKTQQKNLRGSRGGISSSEEPRLSPRLNRLLSSASSQKL